MKGSVH